MAGEALCAASPFTCPTGVVAGDTLVAVLISVVALGAVLHADRVEKKSVPWAGVTLFLCGPSAAEALSMAGLAFQSLHIPVLRVGAFLVRHAGSVAVDLQAFLTGGAPPR